MLSYHYMGIYMYPVTFLGSQSKIKHCMTVFRVRSISFEPLVGFTNNFAQMSSMMRQCAVPMFDQGRFKVNVTILN